MSGQRIIISETVKPPPHVFYGDSYERGLDPWHVDAFPGELRKIGESVAERMGSTGARKGGWFLVDAYGNTIGFIKDGTVVETATTETQS